MCNPDLIRNAAVSPYGWDVTTNDGRSGNVANNPNDRYYAPVKQWMDIHFPAPPDPFAKPVFEGAGGGASGNPAKFDTPSKAVTTVSGNGGAKNIGSGSNNVTRLGGVSVFNPRERTK